MIVCFESQSKPNTHIVYLTTELELSVNLKQFCSILYIMPKFDFGFPIVIIRVCIEQQQQKVRFEPHRENGCFVVRNHQWEGQPMDIPNLTRTFTIMLYGNCNRKDCYIIHIKIVYVANLCSWDDKSECYLVTNTHNYFSQWKSNLSCSYVYSHNTIHHKIANMF